MLAELSSGGLGKRGHALGSRHCGVAVRISRFLQQVEGLDDVIALAAVGLALRALKASQETIDAKRKRVARILGDWRLIVHVPTGDFQMSLSRWGARPTLASSRRIISEIKTGAPRLSEAASG